MKRIAVLLMTAVLALTLAACAPTSGSEAGTDQAAGAGSPAATMDHSAMSGSDHAAMTAGQPFDLLFIDSMIPHHEGAITMAQQALEQSEHDEIKTLAQAIIDAQQQEIAQMQAWRTAWYTDTAPSAGMGMDMGMMEVPAGEQPFDLRFIDAMIPHHEGAIAMAQEALSKADHAEIKTLAQAIIDAQQQEIAQLKQWRAAWYPDAQ